MARSDLAWTARLDDKDGLGLPAPLFDVAPLMGVIAVQRMHRRSKSQSFFGSEEKES